MTVMVGNDDLREMLNGLRALKAIAQADADKAKGASYQQQFLDAVERYEDMIARYEGALKLAR